MNPIEQIEVVDKSTIPNIVKRGKHRLLWNSLLGLPEGKCLKVPPMDRKTSTNIGCGGRWFLRNRLEERLHIRNTPEASYLWLERRNDP